MGYLPVTLDDTNLRGVCTDGDKHDPAIFLNETFPGHDIPDARRFTLAHELCHLLVDPVRGRTLAMASGPLAPLGVEKRANAFAAMLLMPLSLVSRAGAAITEPTDTVAGIRQVAQYPRRH